MINKDNQTIFGFPVVFRDDMPQNIVAFGPPLLNDEDCAALGISAISLQMGAEKSESYLTSDNPVAAKLREAMEWHRAQTSLSDEDK